MIATGLRGAAEQVVRRAQRQGYVLPREVRDELERLGLPADLWKDVIALGRPSLTYRGGRYYFIPEVSPRVREQQNLQRAVERAVRRIIRSQRPDHEGKERRGQDRIDFVQPVQVTTEDGTTLTLMSRDLSVSGIRLIGPRGFPGQKVRVRIRLGDEPPATFLVRILWTCGVGDGMVENGGQFLEMVESE